MSGATVSLSDRLIGAASVASGHERANKESASCGAPGSHDPWTPRCVSMSPVSESSATNGWNQNYNFVQPREPEQQQ